MSKRHQQHLLPLIQDLQAVIDHHVALLVPTEEDLEDNPDLKPVTAGPLIANKWVIVIEIDDAGDPEGEGWTQMTSAEGVRDTMADGLLFRGLYGS
jgi:hypothetical protein